MKIRIKSIIKEYDIDSPIFIFAIAQIKQFYSDNKIEDRDKLLKKLIDMKLNIKDKYKNIRADILSEQDVLDALDLAIAMTEAENRFVEQYKN